MCVFFPHLLFCSFLLSEVKVSGFSVCVSVSLCVCACPHSKLTFNLGVQVIDDNLELAQRHVSQVGGLQTPLHETLADVRHVWQLNKGQTKKVGHDARFVVILQFWLGEIKPVLTIQGRAQEGKVE